MRKLDCYHVWKGGWNSSKIDPSKNSAYVISELEKTLGNVNYETLTLYYYLGVVC
jgi:hypothetical protein